jgi:hypothetical protein
MKKLIIIFTLCSSLTAFADIDEKSLKGMEPTIAEVETARSCFRELEVMGCGHPRDDLKQFRACKDHVNASLTKDCQKMIKELYGKK